MPHRRTPVSFKQRVAPGESVVVHPRAQPPDGYEADLLRTPTEAPKCFNIDNVNYRAPVSLTVTNIGTEPAIFEATLFGDTPAMSRPEPDEVKLPPGGLCPRCHEDELAGSCSGNYICMSCGIVTPEGALDVDD